MIAFSQFYRIILLFVSYISIIVINLTIGYVQKMKRLLILLIGLVVSGPAHASTLALDIVCDEWPPYQTVDQNGNLGGFSTDVVNAVLERMNVKVNSLIVYPWKRALTNLQTGKCQALFSANFTQERTEFAWYPKEPLVESLWVIWVKKDSCHTYTGFSALKGKKVGVVRGYSYTEEFWSFLTTHNVYEQANSDEINFKKLNAGRIDYAAAELWNGSQILKTLGYKNIVPITSHPIKSSGLFIMFSKKSVSQDFVAQFSNELIQFKKEPAYQVLLDAYSPDIPLSKPTKCE